MARVKKDIADMHKSPFPVALRALMSEKPITTQEKLAEITGKTRQTVSQYVNGISEPGYDTLIKIADYFDVSIDYLLGRTKDRRKVPSVYDRIGLSEESISILRLAHEARSDPNKFAELVKFINNRSITGAHLFRDKDQEPPMDELERLQSEIKAKLFARTLPQFVDNIIEIATSPNILIDAYSQIRNPDCRPAGLSDVMPNNDFIEYKIYQITNVINWYLREDFIEIEPF